MRRVVAENLSRPTTTDDRPALSGQIALGLLLFGVYLLIDALGGASRRAAARRHGRSIYDVERWLHVDVEHTLNAWLAPHRVLSTLADYEYAYTYILSAAAVFVWVWVRRPEEWRFARDSFVVLNLLAMTTFLVYPVAPPRMLGELGFVDTVSRGHTVGSWGGGIVDTANQVAAMPSLHIGWALWVSVVLARFTVSRWVQMGSALHVLLTLYVVMATANHYLLDALVVVLPILAGTGYARWRYDGPPGEVVASCDAFFLHVDATGAPQHVGGLAVFEVGDQRPSLADLRRLVSERLIPLPRFRQRIETTSRWRRPRWVQVAAVDLGRHVYERRVDGLVDGRLGLMRVVAEMAEEPLPRDRPMWRVVLVHGTGADAEAIGSALVVLVHHAMADGIGTVTSAMRLFDPLLPLPAPPQPGPGRLQRAAAVTVGLFLLATDGHADPVGQGSSHRAFRTVDVPLEAVRAGAAVRGARVTDLLIALTADAVRTAAPRLAACVGGSLRVSVPLMVRELDAAMHGNATAAIIVDAPTTGTFDDLVDEVARRTGRLRRPARAMASRFVMATGLRVLPEPSAAWFSRTVYGARFLHVVVSNLPGPSQELRMLGRLPRRVYPILPVAPGTPLALGALSWSGMLGVGLAVDPSLLDADAVAHHLQGRVNQLEAEVVARSLGPVQGQEQPST